MGRNGKTIWNVPHDAKLTAAVGERAVTWAGMDVDVGVHVRVVLGMQSWGWGLASVMWRSVVAEVP